MYWQDEDLIHQKINKLDRLVPAHRKEAKERLQATLAAKAKKMDRRFRFTGGASFLVKASAFILITAWGISLAVPTDQHSPAVLTDDQPRDMAPHQPIAQIDNPVERISVPKASNIPEKKAQSKAKGIEHPVRTGSQRQQAVTRKREAAAPNLTEAAASSDSAGEQAASYLRQVVGEESKKYRLMEGLSAPEERRFVFARMVKGIPLLADHYIVTLDEQNKGKTLAAKQNRLRVNDERIFPDPSHAISSKQAENILTGMLQLVYMPQSGETRGKSLPAIVYRPDISGYVNAMNGQLIGIDPDSKQVSGTTLKVVSTGKRLIVKSREEASALLKAEFDIAVDGRPQLDSDTRYDLLGYGWRIGGGGYVTLQTRETSGQVIGLAYKNYPSSSQTGKKTVAEVAQIAASFLQTYLKPGVTELQIAKTESEKSVTRVFFHELYQQMPLIDQAYSVDVDAVTGKVVGFSGDFAKEKGPVAAKQSELSAAKAASQYLKNHPPQLVYIWPSGHDAPLLVYMPLEPRLLQ